MIDIRTATDSDRDSIREVHMRAFAKGERDVVAALAVSLLGDQTRPETISLLAEVQGRVVGHVVFSPVTAATRKNWLGYLLAPLGVVPERQKSGVGKRLIEVGMARLAANHVDVLFVYGDPEYYARYGFSADAAVGFLPPYTLQYPFGWQAVVLKNGQGAGEESLQLSCVASLCDPALW